MIITNAPSNWHLQDQKLIREYKFGNFKEALEFINEVSELAETANHHPDIEFGWGKAKITITTHDEGNKITQKDIELALEINKIKTYE